MGPRRHLAPVVLVALAGLLTLEASRLLAAAPPPPPPPPTRPAAAAPAPPAARPSPAPVPVPIVEGTVIGPDGKPVKDALVLVQASATGVPGFGDPPVTARSGADGRFRVTVKPRPYHAVRVEAAGLAARTLPRVRAGEPLRIVLDRGGWIEGIARDGTTGAPVPDLRIEARSEQARTAGVVWERGAGVVRATSDAKGRFRLEGLAPGLHTLTARGRGLAAQRRQVALGRTTELYLFAGGGIDGTVKGPDGRPVPGATVAIESATPFARGSSADVEISDASGAVEFLGLETGLYRLVARHPDFAPAWTSVAVERGGDARAAIVLALPGTIVGRLIGNAEQPVAGKVAIAETDGAAPPMSLAPLLTAEANAAGEFRMGGVPPGAHALSVSAPGYGTKRVEATVGGSQRTTDLGDVTLESGLVLRGRVRESDGAPVADARLMAARGFAAIDDGGNGVSDATGTFAIGGLKPGLYRLTVRAPGHGMADREVEPGGEPIDIVLETAGSVTGLVVDERGRPVDTFRVSARIPPRPRGPGGGRMMIGPPRSESVSATDGRFLIDDVPPGTHVVEIAAPERATATLTSVKVSSGAVTDVGRVTLGPGGIVRGTVVDATGVAVPAAVVSFLGAARMAGSSASMAEATTDSAGSFELRGVATGTVQVAAHHPSFADGRATADVDPAKDPPEVRIVLQQGGRIEGRARRNDGTPLQGAVSLFARRMGPPTSGPDTTPIGPDGTFTIEHVTAGSVNLMLMAGGGNQLVGTRERTVDVLEGQTTTVDFVARDILLSGKVTRAGVPMPNLRLRVRGSVMNVMMLGGAITPPGPGPQRMTALTREDGSYEMLVDEPGHSSIQIEGGDGRASYPSQPLDIPDAEAFAFDIALPVASISGIVVDGETEQPVPQAAVMASPIRTDPGGRGGAFGATAIAGADGRFRLEVEPGEHKLAVRAEGYGNESQTVSVAEGGSSDVRVSLSRGLAIRGRVTDVGGRPLGGIRVAAVAGNAQQSRFGGMNQSAADGTFEIGGLAAGVYGMTAQSDLGLFALRPAVSAGAEDVTLTLRRGGRVVVTAIGPDGAPVSGAFASVRSVSGVVASGIGGYAGTNDQGLVEMLVPVGTVELHVGTDGGLTGSATVGVLEGIAVPVEVRLAPKQASAPRP